MTCRNRYLPVLTGTETFDLAPVPNETLLIPNPTCEANLKSDWLRKQEDPAKVIYLIQGTRSG